VRIYTKTGDDGTTGLVGGSRVSKDSLQIEAIGDVDELNSVIGLARTHGAGELDEALGRIQNWLFDLGAELATPEASRFNNDTLDSRQITFLESGIDGMTEKLEPLRNFVLPGGTPLAAGLHHARTVCRRAERSVIRLNLKRSEPLTFLNRLSDWLFTAARYANRERGDVLWSKSNHDSQ